MNGMKLMVVALASWINQEQNVIDYATAASGLADCFANTTGCGVTHKLPAIPVSGHYDRLFAFGSWMETDPRQEARNVQNQQGLGREEQPVG